jgi:hypothetical protein
MTTVFAFPPVRISSHSAWVERAPINVSRSFFSGKRFVSAAQRKRRAAQLVVAGLSGDRAGAGYMENLRLLLEGGAHLVRLVSRPVNWWVDAAYLEASRQSQPVVWSTSGDGDVQWYDGGEVTWLDGVPLAGIATTDSDGFPAITITGAAPNMLIARAGDLLTLFSPVDDTVGTTVRVMTNATTDVTGAATIRLMSALTGSGRVNIGTSETAVFEMVAMSEPVQPTQGNWFYDLSFLEVFEDEVPDGFTEVDPWR